MSDFIHWEEMTRRKVIHLVPRWGQGPDGVRDYVALVAECMAANYQAECLILAASGKNEAAEGVIILDERNETCLAGSLARLTVDAGISAVVLHFAGYGYQKRGLPVWLLRGLQRFRRQHMHVRIITLFHELFANGKPWTSAFWTSLPQRAIVRGLLRLTDVPFVTNAECKDIVVRWLPVSDNLIHMPVFSNVGEPTNCSLACEREQLAVIFGLQTTVERLLRRDAELAAVLKSLKVKEVFDIGPRKAKLPSDIGGVPVTTLGALPAAKISAVLSRARFGFIDYPVRLIGKSGVFAAYASHGVIPIMFYERPMERRRTDEEEEQKGYFVSSLAVPQISGSLDRLDMTQGRVLDWYCAHSIQRHADALCAAIPAPCVSG